MNIISTDLNFPISFFPESPFGTALTTMDLIELDGSGPSPNKYGTYELVFFTILPYTQSINDAFGKISRHARTILNTITSYSSDAKINPKDTMENPDPVDPIYLITNKVPDSDFNLNG